MSEKKIYRIKKEVKNHKCEKCGKGFKEDRYLQQHLKRKTECDKKINCSKCGKECANSHILDAHLNRVNSCVPEEIPIIKGDNEENRCQFCNNTYSNKHNLKRHQKTCDKETNLQFIIKKIVEESDKKWEKRMKEQNQELIDIIQQNGLGNQITNNTMNVQQNNNIYVNVSIVPFGEEDYSKLDQTKVLELIKGNAADFIPQMIEHIYADPKKPAYHNVFYDKQSKSIIKYASISADVKTWVKTDARTVSSQISSRLTKFIHPLNSPYFNEVLKTNDTETANKIIDLSNSKEDPFEKNIESLSIITKNPHFTDQVKVQELEN